MHRSPNAFPRFTPTQQRLFSTMAKTDSSFGVIDASPTKDFFVSMLTRDISLDDAVLDLLDNCVDGILRNDLKKDDDTPYKGRYAHVVVENGYFSIADNCGGIPWSLKDYAFRMGRTVDAPNTNLPTVGVYGIGMKRAIFKIGRACVIQTWNGADAYDVEFDEDWLKNENSWSLEAHASKTKPKERGTTIIIEKLNEVVEKEFSERRDDFVNCLIKAIKSHYSAIIEKGFVIRVNTTDVQPLPVKLAFDQGLSKKAIRPYIYETRFDGVKVFLAIGFTRPISNKNEQEEETANPKYDASRTGWTVICNDRVILYCDKEEQTGWGIGRVPKYHPQFNAISGVVIFESNDARKLPTVTTKRGLNMNSILYLHVRERMSEGLKIFTDFTNKWKDDVDEAKSEIKKAKLISIPEIRAAAAKLDYSTSRQVIGGRYSRPDLPVPPRPTAITRRIVFSKPIDDIRLVAEFLFGDPEIDASDVGEKCFDNAAREAKRK
jgi:hypothetical protein